MKIINKTQLAEAPEGAVFMLWEPNHLYDGIHIKTDGMGYTEEKPSWNGELLIEPFFKDWNTIRMSVLK